LLGELFHIQHRVVRAAIGPDQYVQLQAHRDRVAVCVWWIKNPVRKVTIVVPVLITSYEVSLKPTPDPARATPGRAEKASLNQ
jgi:hypothetical protein